MNRIIGAEKREDWQEYGEQCKTFALLGILLHTLAQPNLGFIFRTLFSPEELHMNNLEYKKCKEADYGD